MIDKSKLDEAFNAEIARVSTLEYNANEICCHFYAKLCERLATTSTEPAKEAAKSGAAALTDSEIIDIARQFHSWGFGYRQDDSGAWTIPNLPNCIEDYTRAIETELASRGAAQGRITQDNGVGSSPADAGGLTRYRPNGVNFWPQPHIEGEFFKADDVLPLLATKAAQADDLPAILFDGHAVYREVMANDPNTPRPTADNVANVLDAVVRLIRRDAATSASASPAAPKQGCSWPVGNCQCAPLIQERDELRIEVDRLRASPAAAVAAPAPAPVAGSQQVPILTDAQIEPEARKYALYVRPNGDLDQLGDYDVTKYECREDFFNCVRACIALAAAAPAVPVPAEQPKLSADAVQWVVNDNAELGVKIGNQFFFLYKGDSLVYESGKHDDDTPMMWRPVGKREFGECCHPVKFYKEGASLPKRYTDELTYIPGLSFGRPGDCDWQPLPAAPSLQQPKEGGA